MNTTQGDMPDPTLTVFANFRINEPERLLRMKDSFLSFKEIDAVQWVINVRGRYKMDALCFLHGHLQERLVPHLIESGRGWFADTRDILPKIDTDFVFFWLEDHINQVDVTNYRAILREMVVSGAQAVRYSWWRNGKLTDVFSGIQKIAYEHIEAFHFGEAENEIMHGGDPKMGYILDIPSIYQIDLFRKIVLADDPTPRRWPKETPFDFEKNSEDVQWLPLKLALPKYELFAPIDDDLGILGSCLQARGLYPCREIRPETAREATINPFKFYAIELLRQLPPNVVKGKLLQIGMVEDVATYIVEHCFKYSMDARLEWYKERRRPPMAGQKSD